MTQNCAECPTEAIVIMDQRPLCLEHYQQRLRLVGTVLGEALKATGFAPSEENVLHCDVPGCEASVSMVSGVPRAEHGWGRLTLYPGDYDLCPEHYRTVTEVLRGSSEVR